jgi:hypothetical protein
MMSVVELRVLKKSRVECEDLRWNSQWNGKSLRITLEHIFDLFQTKNNSRDMACWWMWKRCASCWRLFRNIHTFLILNLIDQWKIWFFNLVIIIIILHSTFIHEVKLSFICLKASWMWMTFESQSQSSLRIYF